MSTSGQRRWLRGILTLAGVGAMAAALIASPVDAALSRKKVKAIARKVATQVVIERADEVKVAFGDADVVISSTTYTDIAGASASVDVPAGSSGLIVARFTAETGAIGATGYLSVRMPIDGGEANPTGADTFSFDNTGSPGDDDFESHAMDRSRMVGPGTHTVQLQARVTGGSVNIDDWHLTVERILV